MERLAPRHKFPILQISLAAITVATAMYFILEAFNPHIDPDSSEWQPREKNPRQKQMEWLFKAFQSKHKK